MRILIIDDSEDERDLAEAMLLSAGYEGFQSVASVGEAYRLLGIGEPPSQEPSAFDLVVLDIVMPDIDGIEACARIRSTARYADVPIIMVTSLADIDSLSNAFVAGATDYITKPIKRVELLARARSALKLKSELDRRKSREGELLKYVSTWGDRHSSHWVDEATGLLIGEVAEAYLTAAANFSTDGETSVIALAVDGLDAIRAQRADVAAEIMARVSRAVRATPATVGVVAAAYRHGVIVLILPELTGEVANDLAEELRESVARLRIPNPESVAADHVTASVSVMTGRAGRWSDRVNLLTGAMANVGRITTGGGQRLALQHVAA